MMRRRRSRPQKRQKVEKFFEDQEQEILRLMTKSASILKKKKTLAEIKELQEKGMIKMVSYHHTQWIFTRDVAAE